VEVVAGRYELEAQLGEGGMGEVWWAKDRTTGEEVALKRISVGRTERHKRAVLRFQREFHTLASLGHPRIIRAFDYGVDRRGPYYTMELLPGSDLGDVLRDRAPLGITEACGLLRDIASGLAALHARGLVHRDLSPRNVRVMEGRAVLFDFGVLMNAGAVTDVAGTPNYLAPEMFSGVPVDGRADLYALGVLAYAMVTGQRPYDARSLEELPEIWQQPLIPPSAHAAVPEALEDLILDLMSREPLARPPSAAVLIDRFTAIGGLEPDPEIVVAPTFVTSAALVGREPEVDAMEDAVEEVVHGRSARFAFEAESGAGKSRLLAEGAMRAKLRGVTPLVVDCDEGEGRPYEAMARLVDEAFAALPETATEAARPDARFLGRLFEPVRRALPTRDRDDGAEPAEDRMRAQMATRAFFRRMAGAQPIALLVDDFQRIDEASGASLLAMAGDEVPGLLIGVGRRLGEPFRAPELAHPFGRVAPCLRIGGLDVAGVEALARSVFGDVPNLSRLAKALHEATDGSPLFCTEAIRKLVDDDHVRYAEGSWIVPADIRAADVPAGLADTLSDRLQAIGPFAHALGQLLAVYEAPTELERIVDLARGWDGAEHDPEDPTPVFGALSELAQAGVLTERGSGLGFANESFRLALLGTMDDERKRTLHRHIGEVLAEDPTAHEGQIGRHLVRGGDMQRGAPMLERAGRALFEAQALADCIEPLELALQARKAAGAPPAVIADLQYLLLNAGWVSDREVAARYGEEAVLILGDLAGIDTMRRWARFVGWRIAFVIAFCFAGIRWLGRFGEARGPTPIRALSQYVIGLSYTTAVAYAANQKDDVQRLTKLIEPFRAFRGQPPYAGYLMIKAMMDVLEGRLVTATDRLGEANRLATRKYFNPLSDMERRVADAGTRSMRITVDVNQFQPRLQEDLAAIESIGLAYYRHCARSIEVVHHRYRGEETVARALEAQLEAEELQLGSWSTELQRLLFAHPAYALCHDVEGLKRSLDALERRVAEGMALEQRIVMTRAEILRERGRPEEALALVEPMLESLEPTNHLFRQYGGSTAAQAALEMYRWGLAAEHAQKVLDDGADEAVRVVLPWLRAQRVLGLAEDAQGDSEAGARRIEAAIAKAEALDCPVMAGELHEARARIAFATEDRVAFLLHRQKCDEWLRPTENPGLIAVVERLFELDRESELGPVDARRRRPGASSDVSITALTPVAEAGSEEAATVATGSRSESRSHSGSVAVGVTREESFSGPEATVASGPMAKRSAEDS
jgi:hypothetical protein